MIRAIAVALVVAATAAHGHADEPRPTRSTINPLPLALSTIALPRTRVVLQLDASWHAVPAARAVGLVAGYTTDAGALLAVTRAEVPNPDAWRAKTRAAYLESIEQGIARHIPGYRRVTLATGEVRGVPVLDVTATREGGKTIVIRVLAFRTYALALACELDAKPAALADVRAVVAAFQPSP